MQVQQWQGVSRRIILIVCLLGIVPLTGCEWFAPGGETEVASINVSVPEDYARLRARVDEFASFCLNDRLNRAFSMSTEEYQERVRFRIFQRFYAPVANSRTRKAYEIKSILFSEDRQAATVTLIYHSTIQPGNAIEVPHLEEDSDPWVLENGEWRLDLDIDRFVFEVSGVETSLLRPTESKE